MDIINEEFSCRNEILVLPKMYATLDSEFVQFERIATALAECRDFSMVHYFHFTAEGKPWMWGSDADKMLEGYSPEAANVMKKWLEMFKNVCT